MKHDLVCSLSFFAMLLFFNSPLKAQTAPAFSLQQLIDSAMKYNRLLLIKDWQVQEKMSKLREDEIKKMPSASLDGNYQYNFKLATLSIPAGTIGSIPMGTGTNQLLPEEKTDFQLGDRSTYNIGLTFYQPVTQQAKINTGLAIDRTEIQLTEKEKDKLKLQLQQGIEKLYYGILISQKQMEESAARLELAKGKLVDVQNALQAGETITANIAGLQAGIAEEEQNVLKLNIQLQDYMSELINLTNVHADTLVLKPVAVAVSGLLPVVAYKNALMFNPDIQIAGLNRQKALLGITAARQSNLPDIGLVAGFYYQQGNPILATYSPYIGISFKWNLQDIFSNNAVQRQRGYQLKQTEENMTFVQQQVNSDVEKAWRKVKQAGALIDAAAKALKYRKEELKVQEDKQAAGLDIKNNLLLQKAQLAKAVADWYAAQLSYIISVSELKYLTGKSGDLQYRGIDGRQE